MNQALIASVFRSQGRADRFCLGLFKVSEELLEILGSNDYALSRGRRVRPVGHNTVTIHSFEHLQWVTALARDGR